MVNNRKGFPKGANAQHTGGNGSSASQNTNSNSKGDQSQTNRNTGGGNSAFAGELPKGNSLDLLQNPNQPASNNNQPLASIGGHQIQQASNGGVIINGATIPPGSATAQSSTTISVASNAVIINGATYASPLGTRPPLPISGLPITKNPNGALLAGDCTTPGNQATLSSRLISTASSFTTIDGSTYALTSAPTPAIDAIISPGGSAATVSGIVYSIPLEGSGVVVDGEMMPLPTSPPQSLFTVAGETFTANPAGFVVQRETISLDGAAVTLSGTVVSLGPSGLRVESVTVPVETAEATAGAGAGAGPGVLVLGVSGSGLGMGLTGSIGGNGSGLVAFTGGSSRLGGGIWSAVWALVGVGFGVSVWVI